MAQVTAVVVTAAAATVMKTDLAKDHSPQLVLLIDHSMQTLLSTAHLLDAHSSWS